MVETLGWRHLADRRTEDIMLCMIMGVLGGGGTRGHLPPGSGSGIYSDVLYIRELKVYVYLTS